MQVAVLSLISSVQDRHTNLGYSPVGFWPLPNREYVHIPQIVLIPALWPAGSNGNHVAKAHVDATGCDVVFWPFIVYGHAFPSNQCGHGIHCLVAVAFA